MEMRAGIALSTWNGLSLQTNRNITLREISFFRKLDESELWSSEWDDCARMNISGSGYVF